MVFLKYTLLEINMAWIDSFKSNCARNALCSCYLLYFTGIIPAFSWAMCLKIGWARSKCCNGGLHHPPALFGSALFGGQKFVAVTIIDPGRHHLLSLKHLSSKQAPHVRPLLNRAVLNAAVVVPYPWLYRFPYPHAPPVPNRRVSSHLYYQLEHMESVGLTLKHFSFVFFNNFCTNYKLKDFM